MLLQFYFLNLFVLGLIKIINSQEHQSTGVLKSLKKTLKLVLLAFFSDLSDENLSRTEVVKYLTFLSSNWKFYQKHFLMENYVVDMHWWVPSQMIYRVLAPILLLLKYFSWWNLFCMPCSSCGMFYQYLQ